MDTLRSLPCTLNDHQSPTYAQTHTPGLCHTHTGTFRHISTSLHRSAWSQTYRYIPRLHPDSLRQATTDTKQILKLRYTFSRTQSYTQVVGQTTCTDPHFYRQQPNFLQQTLPHRQHLWTHSLVKSYISAHRQSHTYYPALIDNSHVLTVTSS